MSEPHDKLDFAITNENGEKISLLKSMQKNGLLLKFPSIDDKKHITFMGDSSGIRLHVTDESQKESGDKSLIYPFRVSVNFQDEVTISY